MRDKIVFWLDAHLTYYCLLYYMQQKYDADYFAIIDVPDRLKSFFQNQKLVNFKKIWFYHDHINKKQNLDIDYLTNFETNYDINLWQMAINDRIFYKYNPFHKFTRQEILSILEQECKLFEQIIDEIKPNFLITQDGGLRQDHLFYELCMKKNIHVITINIAKIAGGCYLSQQIHTIDNLKSLDAVKAKGRSVNELQRKLKNSSLSVSLMDFTNKTRSSKLALFKAAFQLLFMSSNSNLRTHYTYYGRTKLRLLVNEFLNIFKVKYRNYYLNKHSYHKIEDEKFIYLPLHQEPERSLLLDAPFYTDQIETTKNVAKSIPVNHVLYVKEHPTQGRARGWRPVSDYKEILAIPNVKMIHPSIPSDELIKKSSLVISVGGTASFEAAFYEKPSIMFADLGYTILPSVFQIKSFDDLPQTIRRALNTKISHIDLDRYVTVLEESLFDFNWMDFIVKYQQKFFYNGNLADAEINVKDMREFLEEQKTVLVKLADQHIDKIMQCKAKRDD